jgi:hypothetical protein
LYIKNECGYKKETFELPKIIGRWGNFNLHRSRKKASQIVPGKNLKRKMTSYWGEKEKM